MGILDKIIKKGNDDEKKDADKKEKKDDRQKEIKEKESRKEKDKKEKETKKKADKLPPKPKAKKISVEKIPVCHFDLIKKPHISEKALGANSANKYVFVVRRSANKTEIKKAVAGLYGVIVENVNIVKMPPKPKRFRGIPGVKSGYKKAIVTLKKGNTIDIMKEKK